MSEIKGYGLMLRAMVTGGYGRNFGGYGSRNLLRLSSFSYGRNRLPVTRNSRGVLIISLDIIKYHERA